MMQAAAFGDLLLAASGEFLIIVDPATLNIVAANPHAEACFAPTNGTLVGRPITDLECGLQDVFYWNSVGAGQAEDVLNAEGLYALPDGNTLPIEKSIRQVQSGDQTWLVVQARDNRHAIKVASNLEQTTSLLRATLESTAEGILVTDLNGRIVNFNHRFAELWGIPQAVLDRGRDWSVFRSALSQLTAPGAGRERMRELLSSREDETFDTFQLRNDRSMECRSRPQLMQDQVLGRVFSFTDVTERMHYERELAAARDTAQSASRAKTEFLSQMSHELRTPLNAIIGFAQVLKADLTASEADNAMSIEKAGHHLLSLINELLDMAKIEAGRLDVNMATVDLTELCRDCLMLLQPLANRYNVDLSHPTFDDKILVRADPLRLKQMLINLLSNAIKYNKEKGRVWLEVSVGNGRVRLSIIDTGIGISDSDIRQLFQTFTRVGHKQKQVEGTGIGLAFTRQLAQLMQGDVGCSSTLNVGSRFWIDLQHAEAGPPNESTTLDSLDSIARLCRTRKRMLYIEDDTVSRFLVQRILAKHPEIELIMADSGKAGLTMARELAPDLIMCDMNLGDMNGFEILLELQEQPSTAHIPIFTLSGDCKPDDIETALAAGFSRYLTKPVQIPALLMAIREIFNET